MSITVEVGLLSGKTVAVNAGVDEEVRALQLRGQIALGVGKGRLVNASGRMLDACSTLQDAGLQNGDSLILHVNKVQVVAAHSAFAAILGDGSVVTWGYSRYGGGSRAVQHQLKNAQQIQHTDRAFAAILNNRSVVTWGDARSGGDSRAVQHKLNNVQQIQASDGAFAAILGDGSVVTWGDTEDGGDCSAVQDQLVDVQQIQASSGSFRCHSRRWICRDLG